VNGVHPALAFLHEKMPTARAVGADTLRLEIHGERVEIFVAPENDGPALFAAGATRLAYRCRSGLSPLVKERLRRVLLELKAALAAGRIVDPRSALPEGGGWTDRILGSDLSAWRDWVTRGYRAAVEAGRSDDCHGLPDCLDLRMRPPIPLASVALSTPPHTGPCARCGRVRVCPTAQESAEDMPALKPLRHADTTSAELTALRVLAREAAVPMADAFEAYTLLISACGDRTLAGALPLEYSVRLSQGTRQPDRLRFVNYYPMVASDPVRREINRGRRAAVRALAARWLTPQERAALDTWLECATETQPDTLGLSIGLELDPTGIRLQVYAHPGPSDGADRLANAVVGRLGGAAEILPLQGSPPVLVGIALSAGGPTALKLYYRRTWDDRRDTGLRPEGLGELEAFNPGWGLAIQEHVDGRAAWVKWDFPVTTHYQVYDRFLAAFWRTIGDPEAAVPDWLSGEHFSPWPTWASLGRGGAALYFVAR
jgi:hypothetical protein